MLPHLICHEACHAWLGKTPNSEFESSTEGYAWLNEPMVEAEALDLPLEVVRAARWLGTRARRGQTSWRRCSAIRGHSGRTFITAWYYFGYSPQRTG